MATMPSEIGRYQIKSRIGRGGMGDVYLARDPNTERLVALKLLNATLDSTEIRERFTREARALAALNHPNIVNIYDTGEFDDSPFIVMEYIRGETLGEMIKRKAPLSVSRKLKLMAELCAGLAQAHEVGIVHRDIKPANLLVDQQGRLKILDFGIARVIEENRTHVGIPLTQVNMMIGTPGYMSPEQVEGREVDHRSDIFAVGAVCYAVFSYGEAFSGANTRQIESRVLQGRPAPLTSVVPGLDPEIDEIVTRALKRDPDKRYQDAGTFEKALERVRARLGPDEERGAQGRATPPPPAVSAGGLSREARAEAAHQRALAHHYAGAPDAAKRSALEALAEDPTHTGANALLARLDHYRAQQSSQAAAAPPPPPPRPALPDPPQRAAATVVGTVVNEPAPAPAGNKTVVRTVVPGRSAPESAPTVIIAPGGAGGGRSPQGSSGRAAAGARQPQRARPGFGDRLRGFYEQLTRPSQGPGRRSEPMWMRYRWVALGVLLLAVAGVLVLVLAGGLSKPNELLTISRPTGGTISAPGITCGTRGSDCTINRPKGDPIELTVEADAGYTFVSYTGDCAPSGRTILTTGRSCGATFAKSEAPVVDGAPTQVMTISPVPTGGTLEGVDIICGSKGSVCSAKYPDGVPVEFHPTADPGYTFMGFVGDCAPLGHTQMTGSKSCSATFSLTKDVSAPPPIKPQPARPSSAVAVATPPAPAPPGRAPEAPTPGTAAPSAPPVRRPPATAAQTGPVVVPETDEEFAKKRIQETLKALCDAEEALDPEGVQKVYPKVNMDALKVQLNRSKYRSVQCKFGDVVFVSLDAQGGSAKVQAPLKRVYEHTILTEKPQVNELNATIALVRLGPRTQWLIDTASYKLKQ